MGQVDDAKLSSKKSKRAPDTRAPRFNNSKFVNYELDKPLQAQCKAWDMDESGVFDAVHRMVSDGYSFSLKWDAWSSSFACFVSQNSEGGTNAGYILTGRGSSPFKAAKQALFKHFVCFDGADWSAYAERTSLDQIDD